MTSPVFDFKAIARKLNCQEQKADFEEKNPKPDPNKIVWSPEWGYGLAAPFDPASFQFVTGWEAVEAEV